MTKPDKKTLARLYVDQGLSVREIAGRLALHPDTIHFREKLPIAFLPRPGQTLLAASLREQKANRPA